MEEEIIIVIKPRRVKYIGANASSGETTPAPAPESVRTFDSPAAAIKYLANRLDD